MYSTFNHYHPKLEATNMSCESYINKQIVVYLCTGILYNNKKKDAINPWKDVQEPGCIGWISHHWDKIPDCHNLRRGFFGSWLQRVQLMVGWLQGRNGVVEWHGGRCGIGNLFNLWQPRNRGREYTLQGHNPCDLPSPTRPHLLAVHWAVNSATDWWGEALIIQSPSRSPTFEHMGLWGTF